jgi:hypothetical protein
MRFFVTDGSVGNHMGAENLKVSSNTELLEPTVWAVLFSEKYGIGLPFYVCRKKGERTMIRR